MIRPKLGRFLGRLFGSVLGGWKLYVVAALAGGLLVGSAAWEVQHLVWGAALANEKAARAIDMKAISDAAATQAIRNQQTVQRMDAALAALDEHHTLEMTNARIEGDRLRAAVADGTRRLSIRATCPASGGRATSAAASTAGMGDAAGRAELDPRDAAAVLGIVQRGDAAIRQLAACQDYVRSVIGRDGG